MAYALETPKILDTTASVAAPTADITSTGDLEIVVVVHPNAAQVPADSKSNALAQAVENAYFGTVSIGLHYKQAPVVGSGHNFWNGTDGANVGGALSATFWSGSIASPLGPTNSGGEFGSSYSTLQPGSVTPPEDGCLIVTAVATQNDNPALTFGIDSGFTIIHQSPAAFQGYGMAVAYLIQTTAAAVNPTWSAFISGSPSAQLKPAVIAVFKPAGSSPQTATPTAAEATWTPGVANSFPQTATPTPAVAAWSVENATVIPSAHPISTSSLGDWSAQGAASAHAALADLSDLSFARSANPGATPLVVSFGNLVVGASARLKVRYRRAPLPAPGFSENFDTIASPRGRGGDLDSTLWATAHLRPSEENYTRASNFPAGLQAGFNPPSPSSATLVYPPYDTIRDDSGRMVMSPCIQNYGNTVYMIRRPFDFASRTGVVVLYTDAFTTNLGTYLQFALTEDPAPAPTFLQFSNYETGPIPRNALILPFDAGSGGTTTTPSTSVNVAGDHAYTLAAFVQTALSPTTNLTGGSKPTTEQGKLNRIEIRISTSLVSVYMSDKSADGNLTFPNQRLVWEAPITLGFTRGYVHLCYRNHASVKYQGAAYRNWIYLLDNVSFDGPTLPIPRAYEVPDNTNVYTVAGDTEMGEPSTISVMELGYSMSDGSPGDRTTKGLWDRNGSGGWTYRGPVSFAGSVNLTGASSAKLTLNLQSLTAFEAVTTSNGLEYRFNGGTWRTRLLTADEVVGINTAGAGGVGLVVDVLLADLTSGTNTVDFSFIQTGGQNKFAYPPIASNIDLLVYL